MSIALRSHRTGHVVLMVAGSFGAGEARELRHMLAELAPEERVVVDFHEVRLFDEGAVETLGSELASGEAGHVEIRGLPEHQHHVLRSMGARLGGG